MKTFIANLKENYSVKTYKQRVIYWCGVYLGIVLILSIIFSFVFRDVHYETGNLSQDFKENLQASYRDGSLENIECYNAGKPNPRELSSKYTPEQTRKILDESGLMDGTAYPVGSSSGRDSYTRRFEPEDSRRPTIVVTSAQYVSSANSTTCIDKIIE